MLVPMVPWLLRGGVEVDQVCLDAHEMLSTIRFSHADAVSAKALFTRLSSFHGTWRGTHDKQWLSVGVRKREDDIPLSVVSTRRCQISTWNILKRRGELRRFSSVDQVGL